MSKPRLVQIGNDIAGVRTVEQLLKIRLGHYDMMTFGAEPRRNDSHVLFSPVLAGEMTIQEIVLKELGWYKEKGISLGTGKQMVKIERGGCKLVAQGEAGRVYHSLLIATGSTAFIWSIPGNDLLAQRAANGLKPRRIVENDSKPAYDPKGYAVGKFVPRRAHVYGLEHPPVRAGQRRRQPFAWRRHRSLQRLGDFHQTESPRRLRNVGHAPVPEADSCRKFEVKVENGQLFSAIQV